MSNIWQSVARKVYAIAEERESYGPVCNYFLIVPLHRILLSRKSDI